MKPKDKKNLIRAAHAGGKMLRKYFGKALNPVEKSTLWDFQTEADIASEKAILKILKKEFPKYNIHSEEEGKLDNGSNFTIAVDPLDGTNNFVLGIPNFSVSIAILSQNEAVAGVVYQPILNQTYYAEKGKGAFLNDRKIRVNPVVDKNKMTIAYNCGYKNSRKRIAACLENLMLSGHKRITFNWSPAYDHCLLASGKIESIINDTGTEIYDYGAGKLIAREAGAEIVDLDGNKEISYVNDQFIISNSKGTNKYIASILKSLKQNSSL